MFYTVVNKNINHKVNLGQTWKDGFALVNQVKVWEEAPRPQTQNGRNEWLLRDLSLLQTEQNLSQHVTFFPFIYLFGSPVVCKG
jgi:hypothetical protein